MKKYNWNKLVIFILSTLSLTLIAVESKQSDWKINFEEVKKQSEKNGRPILINFTGSDWCGWCIKLEKEVFSQDEFKKYAAENLVLLTVDFPRAKKLPDEIVKQNKELTEKYHVHGFPTILLIEADGSVIAKTGYQEGGVTVYVKHLSDLLDQRKVKDDKN